MQAVHSAVSPQGIVNCIYYPSRDQKLNVRVRFETGLFNGVEYKVFYTDGSAFIQGKRNEPLSDSSVEGKWRFSCKSDTAGTADAVRCGLSKGELSIVHTEGRPFEVELGRNLLHGSQLLVRIDENRAITAAAADGFSAEQSAAIITQMRSGKSVDSSYQDLSRQRPTYRTASLFGFVQALDIAAIIFEQLTKSAENRP